MVHQRVDSIAALSKCKSAASAALAVRKADTAGRADTELPGRAADRERVVDTAAAEHIEAPDIALASIAAAVGTAVAADIAAGTAVVVDTAVVAGTAVPVDTGAVAGIEEVVEGDHYLGLCRLSWEVGDG